MEIKYGRKRNGIRKQLRAKLDDWLESIEDEELRKVVANNVIVTGGAIASMLLGEPVNDYDVYFRDKETTLRVAEFYVKKFNENNKAKVAEGVTPYAPEVRQESLLNIKGETEDRVVIYMKSAGVASENQGTYSYFENESADSVEEFSETLDDFFESGSRYRPVFLSQNAITLSDKMQLVIRFYGEPSRIHNNYDYVHAMCSYDYKRDEMTLPPKALEALLSRSLVYEGSLYPIASIFRAKKFLERGWRVNAGQLLKIMWQISEIDLTNFEVLREQLTGVDQAYLHQLIKALEGVDEDKITSAYVVKIIDRIFEGGRE